MDTLIEFEVNTANFAVIRQLITDIFVHRNIDADRISILDLIKDHDLRDDDTKCHYVQIWGTHRVTQYHVPDYKCDTIYGFSLLDVNFTLDEYMTYYRPLVLLGWLPPEKDVTIHINT